MAADGVCMEKGERCTHQVHDDFAVRVGLELVLALQRLAERNVVVDLTVDGEHDRAIFAHEGLGAGVYVSATPRDVSASVVG